MCFRCRLDETWRERIGLLLGTIQMLMAMFGIALVIFAIYLNVRIEEYMLLLEGYNSGAVAHFLISIGCLMTFIHGIGAKISYDLSYSDTRDKFRTITMGFFVLLCCLSIVLMAGGSVCFAHRAIIEESFNKGLFTALKTYKLEMEIKRSLDKIQLDFHCCGSTGYKDWFAVSWIKNDYLDVESYEIKRHLRNGEYFGNSTPFSCCNVSYPRPCVHYDMLKQSAENESFPLYTAGCTQALGSYFSDVVLIPTGRTVFIVFGIELFVIILLRLLHTSIVSAEEEGDPEGDGDAFFIEGCLCYGGGGDLGRYTRKRKKDAEAENATTSEEEEETGWGGTDWGGDGGGGGGGGGEDDDGGGGGGGEKKGKDKGKDKGKKDKEKKQKEKKEKEKKDKGKKEKEKKDKGKKDKGKKDKGKDKKKDTKPKKKEKAKPKKKASPKKASPKKSKSPKKAAGGMGKGKKRR